MISHFSWGQTKKPVRVEFNSISTSGEVVDKEFFRNDSLVISESSGNHLAIFSFEVISGNPGGSSSIPVKGNKFSEEAKALIRTSIAAGQRTLQISAIKLINKKTGKIEEYSEKLTVTIVFE